MLKRLRWFSVLAVAATALTSGAGALLASTAHHARASGAAAGSQTFTVDVDGHNPKANEAFLAYFPSVVRVHAGDTVVFHSVGNGEPHTVTLGSVADAAISAGEKL